MHFKPLRFQNFEIEKGCIKQWDILHRIECVFDRLMEDTDLFFDHHEIEVYLFSLPLLSNNLHTLHILPILSHILLMT